MKPFKGGRKYQGGWIDAAITAGAAILGSVKSDKDKKDAAKQSAELSAEGFRRQSYLDQQQRKWQLEDRQYKENAIRGFAGYGQAGPQGNPTSTAGLANFNPENKPVGGGAMNMGGTPAPQGPVNPYMPEQPLPRPLLRNFT